MNRESRDTRRRVAKVLEGRIKRIAAARTDPDLRAAYTDIARVIHKLTK